MLENPAPVAPLPDEVLRLAVLLIPNEVEAAALSGLPAAGPAAQAAALRQLGPAAVIITLGERGAFVLAPEGEACVPAPAVSAVDTVGAGDAFCGALAVRLVAGDDLPAAARYACHAAALACTRPGAAASLPTRAEVEEFTARLPHDGNLSRALVVPS